LCAKLYPQPAASDKEAKQRCTRLSRQIAKLRGHGLIAKVKNARLYRITKLGSQVLFAVLSFYQSDFPIAFQRAQ
jgi:predicted transcriptional regulator